MFYSLGEVVMREKLYDFLFASTQNSLSLLIFLVNNEASLKFYHHSLYVLVNELLSPQDYRTYIYANCNSP
jgi:hypothetical protein